MKTPHGFLKYEGKCSLTKAGLTQLKIESFELPKMRRGMKAMGLKKADQRHALALARLHRLV